MENFKFCIYCGTKLPSDAKFCSKCGKPINIESIDNVEIEENVEDKLKKLINDPSISEENIDNIKVILSSEGYSKGVKENRARYLKDNKIISHNDYNDILEFINNSTITSSTSPKNIQKEGLHDHVVCCPKCGSTSIVASNKKLSIKRAVVGTMVLNPLAGAIGAVTSKQMYNICQNCGHKWKI